MRCTGCFVRSWLTPMLKALRVWGRVTSACWVIFATNKDSHSPSVPPLSLFFCFRASPTAPSRCQAPSPRRRRRHRSTGSPRYLSHDDGLVVFYGRNSFAAAGRAFTKPTAVEYGPTRRRQSRRLLRCSAMRARTMGHEGGKNLQSPPMVTQASASKLVLAASAIKRATRQQRVRHRGALSSSSSSNNSSNCRSSIQ